MPNQKLTTDAKSSIAVFFRDGQILLCYVYMKGLVGNTYLVQASSPISYQTTLEPSNPYPMDAFNLVI